LHRHFSSRKDLITDLAKIAMKEMDDAVETACANARTYSEVAEISLRVLIPLGNRYSFLELEDLNEDADLKRQIDEQQDETTDMINRAKREGLFDKSVPTAWIVQAYDHLLYAGWESVKAGETTPDQAADLAWRTLINGLGKPQK
jgi:AcrR family transcriptional regulator